MPDTKDTPPDYSKTPVDQLWADWKVEHSKKYETKEQEEHRFGIFKKTLETIATANAKYASGEATYYCGLNQFADLEPHEVCCGGARRSCKRDDK